MNATQLIAAAKRAREYARLTQTRASAAAAAAKAALVRSRQAKIKSKEAKRRAKLAKKAARKAERKSEEARALVAKALKAALKAEKKARKAIKQRTPVKVLKKSRAISTANQTKTSVKQYADTLAPDPLRRERVRRQSA